MRETLETAGLEPQDNRRALKGLLIRPRQQLRYAMLLIGGGIVAQSMIIGGVVFFLRDSIFKITQAYNLDPQVGTSIVHSITNALALTVLVATAIGLIAILVGVKLSHRIYGPMIPFQKHIDELKAGNFASRIRLRKDDELIEMRDALNDLAITLEDRFKTR